ncbi:MAG: hypothetical protein NC132_01350 [Corallococcus sp.]|nr:hypothetical protein [Corallococcus sp.]MCM1359442.1 hypothetical protein [Corallococcus sp.]MCM1394746.1 hypothetical protein [Corallococcus sp.]
MTKTASIVIMSIICVIALFFGVVSFLPDGLEFGDSSIYHAPINLLQKSGAFGDSVTATYEVKLDEDAKIDDVVSGVRSRLADMYGYYFCDVKVTDDGNIQVKIPKIANEEKAQNNGLTNDRILSSVTQKGKVEITTSSTYSADGVVLTSEHIGKTGSENIVSNGNSHYIVNASLNDEGKKIASDKLSASSTGWSAYLFVDETLAGYIAYNSTDSELQIYTQSDAQSKQIIGQINSGALTAELTQTDIEDTSSIGGLLFGVLFATLVVGSWIFYAVRYKTVSLAAVLSQLVVIVVFVLFASLVYFNYLNTAAAIGMVLGYCLMSCFTCLVLEKIRKYTLDDKTFASARYRAFAENNKWNAIVHGIVLVLAIILWVIPTGVTAPLGNALVYATVLSFTATMGLNRLFTAMAGTFVTDDSAKKRVNK